MYSVLKFKKRAFMFYIKRCLLKSTGFPHEIPPAAWVSKLRSLQYNIARSNNYCSMESKLNFIFALIFDIFFLQPGLKSTLCAPFGYISNVPYY